MYEPSIKQKIRKYYLVYAIIPLAVIVLLFIIFIITGYRNAAVRTTKDTGSRIAETLSDNFKQYKREIVSLSNLPAVDTLTHRDENRSTIFEKFYDFNSKQDIKSTLVILGKNGELLLTSTTKDLSFSQILSLREMASRIDEEPDGLLFETNFFDLELSERTVYTLGKEILRGSEPAGHIFLLFHEKNLLGEIFDPAVSITAVSDQFDTIIATTNSSITGILNKFRPDIGGYGTTRIGDNEFYVGISRTADPNLKIYCITSMQTQSNLYLLLVFFIICLSAGLFFILRLLGDNLAKQVTQPIDSMVAAIQKLQDGDTRAYVNIRSNDEFHFLGDQYNLMLNRINKLMSQNEELQEIRRINELKLLQSQFNPHFMFNILECIRYGISMDPLKAQNTILTLSNLLRYSVRKQDELVKLTDDLSYTKNFLALHKARANDRLTYRFAVDRKMEDLLVPRLLLQPLVENSVKYGFKQQMKISILLEGRLSDDRKEMIFKVEDNCGGIEKNLLDKIRYTVRNNDKTIENSRTGIYNLHRRIILLFGEEYRLRLYNNGRGLTGIIRIPVSDKAGEVDHE